MDTEIATGVFSTLAIVAIVGWFYTFWQNLVIDAVRQKMFEIRDEALLWAYENNRINDENYIEFRRMINVSIRHYEKMSLLKIFLINRILNVEKVANKTPKFFMNDPYLKESFKSVIKTSMQGLMARSFLIVIASVILFPIIILMILMNGLKSFKIFNKLSTKVEADFLLAN